MEISFADGALLEVFTITKKGIGLHRQNLKEAGMFTTLLGVSPQRENSPLVVMGVISTPFPSHCSVSFLSGPEHGDRVSVAPCGQQH